MAKAIKIAAGTHEWNLIPTAMPTTKKTTGTPMP
jgi:hypothetical protein